MKIKSPTVARFLQSGWFMSMKIEILHTRWKKKNQVFPFIHSFCIVWLLYSYFLYQKKIVLCWYHFSNLLQENSLHVWKLKEICFKKLYWEDKGPFLYYVRVFWGFYEPPTHLRKGILLHKVRKNCHFLDHPPLCPYVI